MARLLKSTEVTLKNPDKQVEITAPLPSIDYQTLLKEAYQNGYQEALGQKNEVMENNYLNQCNQLHHLLANIHQALQEMRQQLNEEIADIVLHILQNFFIGQQQDKTQLFLHIQQLINQINNQQIVSIYLHPEDISWLKKNENILHLSSHRTLRINADSSLALGGCRIETEHGFFEGSIEERLDKLKKILYQIREGY